MSDNLVKLYKGVRVRIAVVQPQFVITRNKEDLFVLCLQDTQSFNQPDGVNFVYHISGYHDSHIIYNW